MTTNPETANWYEAGCARDCSEQHTYAWGRCALAPESSKPEPTISIGRVDLEADGQPGIVMRSVPLSAWQALITVAKWVSRGKSFALDADPEIAPCYPDASARRALGALHDAGLLDEPVPSAVPDHTLRDRVAAVLRPHASLGGTPLRHELPYFDGATPGLPRISGWHPLDEAVNEVLSVLLPPADRAAVLREAADAVAAETQPERSDVGPSARAGLRDEIVNALGQITTVPPIAHRRAQADNVLAVLYREWPWLRAEAEDAAGVRQPDTETQHAPGRAVLCPDCRAKGHAVCVDGEPRPAKVREAATVDPAMCPRCKGDNSEAFELCARCADQPAR